MDIAQALDFARTAHFGVLTTIRQDGRPQLSNIAYGVTADGNLEISITADRAKYFNLVRDPRASVHVTRADFYAYAVLDGTASLLPVASDPHDATVERLMSLYRSLSGEHPDWDDYRRAMVADHRTLVTLTPTSAYGMLPS
ncbi:MAG TPA: PPOX class F420-dependent oxidoreductase [Ilumatobacteraceae bacterium]